MIKKQTALTLRLVVQGLILALALFGTACTFLLSFEVPFRAGLLSLVLLLYTGGMLLVFSVKKWGLALAAAVVLALAWAFYNGPLLSWGALGLFRHLLLQFNAHSAWSFITLPDTGIAPEIQRYLNTQVILLVFFFVAALSGYAVVRRPSLAGLMLLTLPLAALPLVFMITPPLPALSCLIASYLMLHTFCLSAGMNPFLRLRRKNSETRPPRLSLAQILAVLLILPMVLLSTVLAAFILPPQDYQRPAIADNLGSRLTRLTFGGGLRMGNLDNLGRLRFTGRTVLKVKSTYEQPLYLRGYAGSVYNGSSWGLPPDSDYEQALEYLTQPNPQNYYAAALSFGGYRRSRPSQRERVTPYDLSIQNRSADQNALFLPKGLITDVSSLGNAWFVQDTAAATAPLTGVTDYALRAFPLSDSPPDIPPPAIAGTAADLEPFYLRPAPAKDGQSPSNTDGLALRDFLQMQQNYRRYVYETDTGLPESTRAAAEALCRQYGLRPVITAEGTLDLSQTCDQVARLLDTRCDYSNDPPAIASSADFATAFLNETREGYCVHFATTATVLLRAMGIPARFAEGYVVTASDYGKKRDRDGYIDIADNRAHAWTEVFHPSLMEWIPVEMTPSFSPADGLAQEDITGTFSLSGNVPTPTPEAAPEATPPQAPLPSVSAAPEIQLPEAPHPIWFVWGAVLLAAALSAAAVAGRKIARDRREKAQTQKNTNAAVLAGARWIVSLLQFAGCPMPDSRKPPEAWASLARETLPWLDAPALSAVLRAAQKARFSNEPCTEEERQLVIRFGNALAKRLRDELSPQRRLLLYYVYRLY